VEAQCIETEVLKNDEVTVIAKVEDPALHSTLSIPAE
jgi:hypothetical protein